MCLPDPCDSDPSIANLNGTASECEGVFSLFYPSFLSLSLSLSYTHTHTQRIHTQHTGTLSNSTCNFVCDSSYTSFGTATCYASEWILHDAVCESDCTSSPSFENINHTATSCPERSSRESCAFTCMTGYLMTGPAYCDDGVWVNHSHSLVPCEEAPCTGTLPSIEGFDELSSSCNLTSGETCEFTCLGNFSPSGPVKCERGLWIDGPSCMANCLSAPEGVDRIVWDSSACSNTDSGESCGFNCDSGYTLYPTNNLNCSNGTWTTTGYRCDLDCVSNPTGIEYMDNAATTCSNTASGDLCTFVCEDGHTASSPIPCFNGSYIRTNESCLAGSCDQAPIFPDGQITNCHIPAASGSVCAVNCNPGYTPTRNNVDCFATEWNLTTISSALCVESSCSGSPNMNNLNQSVSVDACDGTSRCNRSFSLHPTPPPPPTHPTT
jgi:hypothetical protein